MYIQITNKCNMLCEHCCFSCTNIGSNMSLKIFRKACEYANYNGLNIFLGGGEPTSHPNLIEILEHCKRYGISPSFSTRKEDWVVENWSKLKGLVGAVGLSVDSNAYLVKRLSKLEVLDGLNVTVQVAVGSCPSETLIDIMKTCEVFGYTVLLLGWSRRLQFE